VIRIGCSGWSYEHWRGVLYPPRGSSSRWLELYAQTFDTVELNATFYRLPSVKTVEGWAARTTDDFLFAVKASRYLTHVKRLREAGKGFERLRERVAPLAEAGKLGYVLFQFAPWIRFSDKGLAYLASLPRQLPGWTVAVEFRDRSWIPEHADETFGALRQLGLGHVVVDAPAAPNAVPRVAMVTAPTSVLRLHGRNVEGWLRQLRGGEPSVREKYDYRYSDDELGALLPEVAQLEEEAERVFISFNNNNRAYPVENARMMLRLLGRRPYGNDEVVR
jgi:uncharacterized protein YecE (DUF72 family)